MTGRTCLALIWLTTFGCERAPTPRIEATTNDDPPTAEPATPVDPDEAQRNRFEAELLRAYPADAPEASETTRVELTAAPTDVPQMDGRALAVWAYNGQVPARVLRVRLGHELEVQLHNRLPQPTTIHWHGMRVPNAMDGVPGVTQEPVAPGASFTYRFTPKDAGTFWFHPHVRTSEQVERGLYGVIVVDDAEPLPYSRDEVWVLDDWRLGSDGQIARNGQPADEPYFRDTVLLHREETIDVGMVPLDWGHWMMHCHILEHAEAGMMTEVWVGED